MQLDEIISDPVFQFNLLLWMAKEQPKYAWRVFPLFHNLGFLIQYIEQPFPLPPAVTQLIDKTKIDASKAPEPEMILGRERDQRALYFEAKKDSFGAASSTCKQARGHLIASGAVFADVLAPLVKAMLCYCTPAAKSPAMAETLATLSKQLKDAGFDPGEFSTQGWKSEGKFIQYAWDAAFATFAEAEGDSANILEFEPDTNPSPLVIVYTDEDCPDLARTWFYRRAMIDQVRAALLCQFQLLSLGTPFVITIRQLLDATTDEIFQYLGKHRQGSLTRLIRENLIKVIVNKWKSSPNGGCVDLTGDTLTVNCNLTAQKEELAGILEDRRLEFPGTQPPAADLFDLYQEPDAPSTESTPPDSNG